jgi:polysaccharide export outer membrane protein
MRIVKIIPVLLTVALFFSSCYNYRSIGLLQENNPKLPRYPEVAYEEYKIKANDEIIFRLITSDKTYSNLLSFNQQGGFGAQNVLSYRVFEDGTIDLPFLKSIPVAGLTTHEAARVMEQRFREIIPDAAVKLTLANKSFTVLGQAGTGVYYMVKDRMTLFQALSMSGDLNPEADFNRVRIIRETEKGLQVMEFDIRPASLIGSEYYYIHPNDIIYVQKSRSSFYKVSNYNSFIGLVTTSVSLLLTVLYFFK